MRTLKQETYYVLSIEEVENLISDCFDKPYTNAEDWQDNSIRTFDIQAIEYGKYAQNDVEQFIAGSRNIALLPLLLALAAKNEIPEGKYLIEGLLK